VTITYAAHLSTIFHHLKLPKTNGFTLESWTVMATPPGRNGHAPLSCKEAGPRLRGLFLDIAPMAPLSALRGHTWKLKKRHCHTQLRSNFFTFRVVNLWNCLPSEVVSAPSVNIFKARLDKHWKDCCFPWIQKILLKDNKWSAKRLSWPNVKGWRQR